MAITSYFLTMHHDVFDLYHFLSLDALLTTFHEDFFFIYGRLIYLFSVSFTPLFFFGKPVLISSHLQKLKLYFASCLLLVVLRFSLFSSSVDSAPFSSVYYACSFLFSSPLTQFIYPYSFFFLLNPPLTLPCRYVVIP